MAPGADVCFCMHVEEGQCYIQLTQLLKMIKEAVLARPTFAALCPWLLRAKTLLNVLAIMGPSDHVEALHADIVCLACQCEGFSKQPNQVCTTLVLVSTHVENPLGMLIRAYRRLGVRFPPFCSIAGVIFMIHRLFM